MKARTLALHSDLGVLNCYRLLRCLTNCKLLKPKTPKFQPFFVDVQPFRRDDLRLPQIGQKTRTDSVLRSVSSSPLTRAIRPFVDIRRLSSNSPMNRIRRMRRWWADRLCKLQNATGLRRAKACQVCKPNRATRSTGSSINVI